MSENMQEYVQVWVAQDFLSLGMCWCVDGDLVLRMYVRMYACRRACTIVMVEECAP